MSESTVTRGLSIPRIVFGTTCLGNLFGVVPDQQKAELIAAWFAAQPTPVAIDAAGKYGAGMALSTLGHVLRDLGIQQEQILLNNKLGWRQIPLRGAKQSFEPDAWFGLKHDAVQDISYEGILRCWEQGCELLGSYQPQMASLHDPDDYLSSSTNEADRAERFTHLIEGYQALKELKQQGEIKAIGVGAKDWRCIRMLREHCDFDWVMLANSFTVMNHPAELIEFLNELQRDNICVINSALFHGGFIVGGELYDYRHVDQNNPLDAARLAWRKQFHLFCQQFQTTPFLAAVDFGRAHPAIQSVALSTSQPGRVSSLVDSVSQPLSAEFWRAAFDAQLIDYMPPR